MRAETIKQLLSGLPNLPEREINAWLKDWWLYKKCKKKKTLIMSSSEADMAFCFNRSQSNALTMWQIKKPKKKKEQLWLFVLSQNQNWDSKGNLGRDQKCGIRCVQTLVGGGRRGLLIYFCHFNPVSYLCLSSPSSPETNTQRKEGNVLSRHPPHLHPITLNVLLCYRLPAFYLITLNWEHILHSLRWLRVPALQTNKQREARRQSSNTLTSGAANWLTVFLSLSAERSPPPASDAATPPRSATWVTAAPEGQFEVQRTGWARGCCKRDLWDHVLARQASSLPPTLVLS